MKLHSSPSCALGKKRGGGVGQEERESKKMPTGRRGIYVITSNPEPVKIWIPKPVRGNICSALPSLGFCRNTSRSKFPYRDLPMAPKSKTSQNNMPLKVDIPIAFATHGIGSRVSKVARLATNHKYCKAETVCQTLSVTLDIDPVLILSPIPQKEGEGWCWDADLWKVIFLLCLFLGTSHFHS